MRKHFLFLVFICSVVVLQSCKKDAATSITTTTTDAPGVTQAYIDGVLWAPDTLSTNITYTNATKTQVLTFTGTKSQKQLVITVTVNNATNDGGFPILNYYVDQTATVAMSYYTQQKLANGTYGFVLVGSAQSGSGRVGVTAVDVTNKTVTGTFSFNANKVTTDASGNITATEVHTIGSGSLSILPYTYTTK